MLLPRYLLLASFVFLLGGLGLCYQYDSPVYICPQGFQKCSQNQTCGLAPVNCTHVECLNPETCVVAATEAGSNVMLLYGCIAFIGVGLLIFVYVLIRVWGTNLSSKSELQEPLV